VEEVVPSQSAAANSVEGVDEVSRTVLGVRLADDVVVRVVLALEVEGTLVHATTSTATRRRPATAKSARLIPETTTYYAPAKTSHARQLLDEGILLPFRTALMSTMSASANGFAQD
jgi:hypothetical protein